MDWAAMAGIGQGLQAAQQYNAQQQQMQWLQQQRQRMLKEQADEDAVQASLAAITPTTTVEDRSEMQPDWQGPVQATKVVPRTEEEMMNARIQALQNTGKLKYITAGMGLRTNALQQKASEQELEKGRFALDQLRDDQAFNQRYQTLYDAISKGDLTNPELINLATTYNKNQGAFNDGTTIHGMSTPQGPMLVRVNAQGKAIEQFPMTAEHLLPRLKQAHRMELAFRNSKYAAEQDKSDVEREKNDILRQYRSQPHYMQDGTGEILAIDSQGQLIGKYGSARPVSEGGSSRNHFVPMSNGYAFNQLTGETIDMATGQKVTDRKVLDNLFKAGAAPKPAQDEPKVEYTSPDGMKITGTAAQVDKARRETDGVHRAGSGNLSMPNPKAAKGGQAEAPALSSYGIKASSKAPSLKEQIDDLNMRLGLEGVDPAVRLEMLARRNALVSQRDAQQGFGGRSYGLATPLPGSR